MAQAGAYRYERRVSWATAVASRSQRGSRVELEGMKPNEQVKAFPAGERPKDRAGMPYLHGVAGWARRDRTATEITP